MGLLDHKKNKIYFIPLLMAQIMVAINIVGSKYLLTHLPALFILTIRFAIATVLLTTVQLSIPKTKMRKDRIKIRELNKKDWGFTIAQALNAGALFNLFLLFGMNYTSATMAGIITSALPAIIATLSIVFLRERLTQLTALCIICCILGLFIINANGFNAANQYNLIGDALILLSLLPEATYYLLAKMHTVKLPVFLLSAIMNAINFPVILAVMLLTHVGKIPHLNITDYTVLIIIGISSAMFYVFWSIGCRHISGSSAGLMTALMPVVTLLIAWIFLNETVSWLQVTGMTLIILSVLLNVIRHKKIQPIITN